MAELMPASRPDSLDGNVFNLGISSDDINNISCVSSYAMFWVPYDLSSDKP